MAHTVEMRVLRWGGGLEAEPAGDVLESHGKFPPVVVVVRVGLGRRQFLMTMGACGVLPTLVLPFIADRGQSGEGTPDVAVTTGEERDVVRWGRRDCIIQKKQI